MFHYHVSGSARITGTELCFAFMFDAEDIHQAMQNAVALFKFDDTSVIQIQKVEQFDAHEPQNVLGQIFGISPQGGF